MGLRQHKKAICCKDTFCLCQKSAQIETSKEHTTVDYFTCFDILQIICSKIYIIHLTPCFQRRDLTVSQVLIFVVLIFLVCHSLKLCLNFYEFSLTLFGKLLRWFNNLQILDIPIFMNIDITFILNFISTIDYNSSHASFS